MTIVETRLITGGVDTYVDVHVAAALDSNGGTLGVESFPTTTTGFAELHTWLLGFGALDRVGVQGTGAYGAGLARFLRGAGVAVIEVGRPNRQARRVTASPTPSTRWRPLELRSAVAPTAWARPPMATWKRSGCCWSPSARDARRAPNTSTSSASSASVAPMTLRERFRGIGVANLASDAAALRPNPDGDPVMHASWPCRPSGGHAPPKVAVTVRSTAPTRPHSSGCSQGWRIVTHATPAGYVGLFNAAMLCDDPVLISSAMTLCSSSNTTGCGRSRIPSRWTILTMSCLPGRLVPSARARTSASSRGPSHFTEWCASPSS